MVAPPSTDKETRFDWPLCHEAESLILGHIDAFLARNTFTARLAARLRDETGTLLLDWVDHLVVSPTEERRLREAGYAASPQTEAGPGLRVWWHPQAMLPRVLIQTEA